ncbi:hypothetical protein [Rothia nasimurium]|uniref:hypothetical protein n=1 Tax=Rothia nasimurium TaxID=85336 RepID=UPI001F3697D9|nr:hypothetical protein [Rothia nasimurium]
MTPDELNSLRELHEQASPAPWVLNACCCSEIVDTNDLQILGLSYEGDTIAENDPDATLAVEARNALPCLLAHIDRLTRRLEIYEARLGRVARNHPEAYAQALAGDTQ